MNTVADAKQWAIDNADELDADRLSSDNEATQMLNRMMPDLCKDLWDSGCWLAQELKLHGATDEQIESIQFAAGQRALGGDVWQASVNYANEFSATGDTKEKSGPVLAEKVHREVFGTQGKAMEE